MRLSCWSSALVARPPRFLGSRKNVVETGCSGTWFDFLISRNAPRSNESYSQRVSFRTLFRIAARTRGAYLLRIPWMRYVMSKVGILWLKGWWWGQIWKFVFNFFHRCLWINLENDELRRNIECFLMDRDRLRSRYINLYFYLYRFISMKINRAVKFFDFCQLIFEDVEIFLNV